MIKWEKCDDILEELGQYFFRDECWDGSPFSKETKVVTGSILKSPTSIENVLCNNLFVEIAFKFLNESNYFWTRNQIKEGDSFIQLKSAITHEVGPNVNNQKYHRKDMIHHNYP